MQKIFLSLITLSLLSNAQEVEQSKLSNSVDMSTYKDILQKDTKISFDSNSSEKNGIYNFQYSPNKPSKEKKTNIFLNGNFDKIHRYDSLYFNNDSLTDDSEKIFDDISKQIHQYIDDKSREIVVSVIAFTQKTEDNKTQVNLESAYTNFFQNIAQRDDEDPQKAKNTAVNYLQIVYDKMLDDNISKEIIYKEDRVGKDALYTEEFSDGRAKNNRVDVAIYVKEVLDPDTDGDGVHDSKDYCRDTPLGTNVDVNGCPRIMKLDLKFDFDKDTISDEKSLEDVKELSDFMKKYPAYHANIVGHTDSVGKASYNQKLSERRAKRVQDMIVADGVDSSRLTSEGRGESEPLFENINPFNRHQNRRTEVELTIPEQKTTLAKPKARSRGPKG